MTRTVLLTEVIAPYRIPVFNALARQPGVDLHVIFLAETHEALRKWRIYTDEIEFSHQVLRGWRWQTEKHDLLLNRGVHSALGTAHPDAIICGGYSYPASWQSLGWAQRHKVRFILWSESNSQDARRDSRAVAWLKRYFVKSCNAFVAPGKSSFAYLRSFGVGEQDIFVAPNAVDNEFFDRQAADARAHDVANREKNGLPQRFVLCVTRFVAEKGIFDLLEAYAKLRDEVRNEVGLVFAGDGPAQAELVSQAQRIHPGTICFPGFVQREELAILYALAEGLMLPTHSDPWGLVVNEAMACGLPIIVTSVAGCTADLVEDGWNGFVVPARDSSRLSVAMDSLLQNPELRQQMGIRSSKRIRDYSPEACARGLAAVAISPGRQAR